MNLKKYIPEGQYWQQVSQAREVPFVNTILNGCEIKVNEIFKQLTEKPQMNKEDLKKDLVFMLGFAAGLNWVLDLPGEAQKYIDHLPEENF